MRLAKIECDKATCPPDEAVSRLADGKGQYLEVTKVGGKYSRLTYRFDSRGKRLALGCLPI